MLDDALRKLRLDRRLLERRGWVSRQELERALAELPDVSDRIAPPDRPEEDEESEAKGGGARTER